MSREVEIIITYDRHDVKSEMFAEWLLGWARSEFRATVSDTGPDRDVLAIAGYDMVKVFTRLYRRAEVVRRRLGANATVAVCEGSESGYECIDMSEVSWPKIILSNSDVERLAKVVQMVKGVIVWERLDDIKVADCGDHVRLSAKCCDVDLQVDEAVMVASRLLHELHSITRFQIFAEADSEILKVFDPLDLTYLPSVDLRHVKEGVYALSVEWCNDIYMTADEVLRLVYKILDTAVSMLKRWRDRGEGDE